jgi:hypothetical protein
MSKEKREEIRELSTSPFDEEAYQKFIERRNRTREFNKRYRQDQRLKTMNEHPTYAKWKPAIMVAGILVICVTFVVVLWLISRVNASSHVPV